MFKLIAPHPGYQTTLVMPSPEWGDYQATASSFIKLRAMDGTLYTYVKPRETIKRYQWTFLLAKHKAFEMLRFVQFYHGSLVKAVTHDDVSLIGYIMNNPTELTASSRAPSWPGGETCQLTIDFEEVA